MKGSDTRETFVHEPVSGEDYCPYCGQVFRSHTATDPGYRIPPSPDDVACCAKCGSIAIFDENMKLRRATAEEVEEIMGEVEAASAITVMQKAIEAMPDGSTQERIVASMDMMRRITNDPR